MAHSRIASVRHSRERVRWESARSGEGRSEFSRRPGPARRSQTHSGRPLPWYLAVSLIHTRRQPGRVQIVVRWQPLMELATENHSPPRMPALRANERGAQRGREHVGIERLSLHDALHHLAGLAASQEADACVELN
jgi:hypothetical protein